MPVTHHTQPREIIARYIRQGDQVAMLGPVDMARPVHVRSVEIATSSPAVMWFDVIAPVELVGPLGEHRLTLAERRYGGSHGRTLETLVPDRQQFVIRERIEIDGWTMMPDEDYDAMHAAATGYNGPEQCGTWAGDGPCRRDMGHTGDCESGIAREVRAALAEIRGIAGATEGQPAAPAGITVASGIVPAQRLPRPGETDREPVGTAGQTVEG